MAEVFLDIYLDDVKPDKNIAAFFSHLKSYKINKIYK